MNGRSPGGAENTARGRITIDTSDLSRVEARTRQTGAVVARNLGQIDTGARAAQRSIQQMATGLERAGQVLGVSLGAAGIGAFGRWALSANATATAYRRQEVAARNLAGSQEELNELLAAYEQATGGVIGKAQALADVTRLQAVGFGDSAEELTKFARAARGISVAMGSSQDYVIGQLQLAIANQSTMRLDQLGLSVSEVKERIDRLKTANRGLSEEMAYQQAILEIADEKYGALADSVEAQATDVELAKKAWADLSVEFGNATSGAQNFMASGLTGWLKDAQRDAGILAAFLGQIRGDMADAGGAGRVPSGLSLRTNDQGAQAIRDQALRAIEFTAQRLAEATDPAEVARLNAEIARLNDIVAAAAVSMSGLDTAARQAIGVYERDRALGINQGRSVGLGGTPANPELDAARLEWAQDRAQIEADAGEAINETARQYAQQRAETVASYELQIARDAQDFARQRAQAEAQYQGAIADAREEAARRELDQAVELARDLADARADSAARVAEWEQSRNERIAELRADSAERLVELEEEFQRDREEAARDHEERLMDAAGRLDARAIAEEQRRYARQREEADAAHARAVDEEQARRDEQIGDEQAAHQKRVDAEAKALQQRLDDLNDAHTRERDAARAALARRLADMQEDFAARKRQEDEERAIRQARMAEDQALQLAQMDTAHQDRIAQIQQQSADEIAELDRAFQEQLTEYEIYADDWLDQQEKLQEDALELFDDWWKEINKRFKPSAPPSGNSPTPLPERDPTVAYPRAMLSSAGLAGLMPVAPVASYSQSRSTSLTLAPGAVQIHAGPGMDEQAIGRAVVAHLEEVLNRL